MIRTGTANLASVGAALERAGRQVASRRDPADGGAPSAWCCPESAPSAPSPTACDELGLRDILAERIAAGRPTLAICLGMQLLAEASEESPGASGLGVVPATATAFRDDLRVPHLGWNRVAAGDGCSLLRTVTPTSPTPSSSTDVPAGWNGAWTDHGGPFVAALERGPVLGCQFHPELSGGWGQSLIERWLAAAEVVDAASARHSVSRRGRTAEWSRAFSSRVFAMPAIRWNAPRPTSAREPTSWFCSMSRRHPKIAATPSRWCGRCGGCCRCR